MNIKLLLATIMVGLAFACPAFSQTVIVPAATITLSPAATIGAQAVKIYTDIPAQDQTINVLTNGSLVGGRFILEINTSGTSSYVITFNSNFATIGTLTTGTTTAVTYLIEFVYDGTNFQEISRIRSGTPTLTTTFVTTTTTLAYAEGVKVYSFTPTAAVTLAIDKVGRAGATFIIKMSGDSTGRAVTPGTNLKITTATISTTADTNAIYLTVVSDGVSWNETARTVATAAAADDNA